MILYNVYWANTIYAYMCQWVGSLLAHIMACHPLGNTSLPETVLAYSSTEPLGTSLVKPLSKSKYQDNM